MQVCELCIKSSKRQLAFVILTHLLASSVVFFLGAPFSLACLLLVLIIASAIYYSKQVLHPPFQRIRFYNGNWWLSNQEAESHPLIVSDGTVVTGYLISLQGHTGKKRVKVLLLSADYPPEQYSALARNLKLCR